MKLTSRFVYRECDFNREYCTKVRVRSEYHHEYFNRNKETLQEQKRLWNRDYYERNKDLLKEEKSVLSRAYYIRNKDTLNENRRDYRRQYDNRNKEARGVYEREYATRNSDTMKRKRKRKYIEALPHNANYAPRNDYLKLWKNQVLVREYFDSISPQLHISHFTDWYRISQTQIINLNGMLVLKMFSFFRFFSFFFIVMDIYYQCDLAFIY
jgi:hypothetical protein